MSALTRAILSLVIVVLLPRSAALLTPAPALPTPSTPTSSVQPATSRLPRRALPDWASKLNGQMEMRLITFADSHHAHAVSGAAWMLLSYGTLLSTSASELAGQDYTSALASAFGSWNPILALASLSGVAVGATGFPMRPKRRLRAYANQMRNSMTSTALLSLMFSALALEASGGLGDGLVAAALSEATRVVVALGAGYIAYDAIDSRTPWDLEPIIDNLKLERPPEVALYAARAISMGWLAMTAAAACHVALPAAALAGADEQAFAAQMCLALALAPSSEALVGTLCLKDRFTKEADAHFFVTRTPSGGVRPAHWLEALELVFNVPGPALLTVLVALQAGHADLVRAFFFLPPQ